MSRETNPGGFIFTCVNRVTTKGLLCWRSPVAAVTRGFPPTTRGGVTGLSPSNPGVVTDSGYVLV